MKISSPFFRTLLGCLSLISFLSFITIAQTTPSTEKERTVRYISSNKGKTASSPSIRVIKRNKISRIPARSIRRLLADDNNLDKKAFNLINAKRVEKKLNKLKWNDSLANLARQHSENMAKHAFFSHIGLNGRLIDQRAIDFGIKKWRAIGENVAYNKGISTPADFAVERWMLSESHKDNLLDSRWTDSGIGVGITEDGFYFFTQVFLVQ